MWNACVRYFGLRDTQGCYVMQLSLLLQISYLLQEKGYYLLYVLLFLLSTMQTCNVKPLDLPWKWKECTVTKLASPRHCYSLDTSSGGAAAVREIGIAPWIRARLALTLPINTVFRGGGRRPLLSPKREKEAAS
jgi:hypothetical protein